MQLVNPWLINIMTTLIWFSLFLPVCVFQMTFFWFAMIYNLQWSIICNENGFNLFTTSGQKDWRRNMFQNRSTVVPTYIHHGSSKNSKFANVNTSLPVATFVSYLLLLSGCFDTFSRTTIPFLSLSHSFFFTHHRTPKSNQSSLPNVPYNPQNQA